MSRPNPDLDRSWMIQAKCLGKDPDLFFPEQGGETARAIAICGTCPVSEQCLDYALVSNEPGIWGGKTDRQRRTIKTKRNKTNSILGTKGLV